MADYITSSNLKMIIEQNQNLKEEVDNQLLLLLNQYNIRMGVKSEEKLAFNILKKYGLLQLPITNRHWGGAIYCIDGKKIPVINTALPRMNQFFVAWHEVYHLLYSQSNESVYEIPAELTLEERKADYFSAKALIGNVYNYYIGLESEEFLDKIALCMDLYQVPYKAILIQLYEDAILSKNRELEEQVIGNFDKKIIDWEERFERLGLDQELVTASYVVNLGYLESKINERRREEPDVSVHEWNLEHLKELKKMLKGVTKE